MVAAEIEMLQEEVETAAFASTLPEEPDMAAIDALVLRAHREQVAADAGP